MEKQYVIGVDGGGTKTVAALADLAGKILKIGQAGASSPTNVGIKTAAENVARALKKILPPNRAILSSYLGLPAAAEVPELIKKIKKELLKHKEISPIFKGKFEIVSDQIVAFQSGTDQKNGVLVIAGTGCVAHGWRGGKEAKTSGWGWLADEGSAFFVGRKVFQAILKDLDGRAPKTILRKIIFKKFKIKKISDFINLIYLRNPTQIIPQFSIICDEAGRSRDGIAKSILEESGRELALAAGTVIRKLNFQNKKFPLVLIGGMFKSKIVLETVKKEIKKNAPKAEFIQPKKEPVIGAIKLAIEALENGNN
jgi:N-acetylglucosamine kinase-like BadF-type ATPase